MMALFLIGRVLWFSGQMFGTDTKTALAVLITKPALFSLLSDHKHRLYSCNIALSQREPNIMRKIPTLEKIQTEWKRPLHRIYSSHNLAYCWCPR